MAAPSSQKRDLGQGNDDGGDAEPVDMKEELKRVLLEYGNGLIQPGDSTERLMFKLEKLEHLLQHLRQDLKEIVEPALEPTKTALISDSLLGHDELVVRFTTASCITEVIRLTAPDEPYTADKMKDYFRLVITALQKLSSCSEHAYSKVVSVIQTISYCQICVMMLDHQLHDMVHEMFHLFLNGIEVNYSEPVFSSMEHIMSLMIQNGGDSEESSMELAKILLNALKKGNQSVSPPAFKLAKRVFENCVSHLKEYLQEAVRLMKVAVEEFDDVVVSAFRDATQQNSMAAPERKRMVSSYEEIDIVGVELSKFVKNGDKCSENDKNVNEKHATVSNLGHQINMQEFDLNRIDHISLPTVDCPEVNNSSINDGSKPPVDKSIIDELCNYDNPKDQNIKQQHEMLGSKNLTDICSGDRDLPEECNAKLMVLEDISQMNDNGITSDEKFLEQANPVDADSTFQPEHIVRSSNNMQQKVQLNDVPIPLKRSRKPRSLISPEEGYDPLWMLSQCVSFGGSSRRKNSGMHTDYRKQNTTLNSSQLSPIPAGEPFNALHSSEDSFSALKPQNKELTNKKDAAADQIQDNDLFTLPHSESNSRNTATFEDISGMESAKEKHDKIPKKDYSVTLADGILKNSAKRKRSFTRVACATQSSSKHVKPDKITSNELDDPDNSKEADIPKHLKKWRGSSKKTLILKPRRQEFKYGTISVEAFDPKFGINVVLPKDQKKKRARAKKTSVGPSKDKIDSFECHTREVVVKKTLRETGKGKAVISETQTEGFIAETLTSQPEREACSKEISNHPQQMNIQSKEEVFEVNTADKCYGDELVGLKIKVWWPLDQIFYEGAVTSFNHSTKKHKITYYDGVKERLDLATERWEIIRDDNLSSDEQKNVSVPPSVSTVKCSDDGSKLSTSSKQKLKGLKKQVVG